MWWHCYRYRIFFEIPWEKFERMLEVILSVILEGINEKNPERILGRTPKRLFEKKIPDFLKAFAYIFIWISELALEEYLKKFVEELLENCLKHSELKITEGTSGGISIEFCKKLHKNSCINNYKNTWLDLCMKEFPQDCW